MEQRSRVEDGEALQHTRPSVSPKEFLRLLLGSVLPRPNRSVSTLPCPHFWEGGPTRTGSLVTKSLLFGKGYSLSVSIKSIQYALSFSMLCILSVIESRTVCHS